MTKQVKAAKPRNSKPTISVLGVVSNSMFRRQTFLSMLVYCVVGLTPTSLVIAKSFPADGYESWPSERKAKWVRHGCNDIKPKEKPTHDDMWCFMTSFMVSSGLEDVDEPFDDLIPPDEVAHRGLIEGVRQKVLKCWSPPPQRLEVFQQLRDITLIVRLRRDGTVESAVLSPQTAKRAAANQTMKDFSDAAIEVVNACQPYNLPIEHFDFWQEISPLQFNRSDFTVQER